MMTPKVTASLSLILFLSGNLEFPCQRPALLLLSVRDPDRWTVAIPLSCPCKQRAFWRFLIRLSQFLFNGSFRLHW